MASMGSSVYCLGIFLRNLVLGAAQYFGDAAEAAAAAAASLLAGVAGDSDIYVTSSCTPVSILYGNKKLKCLGDRFGEMEGSSLPPGNTAQGPPYGSLDLHGVPMQMHPPNSGNQAFNQPQIPGNFTIPMDRVTEPDNISDGVQLRQHGKIAHHHYHKHQPKNHGSDDEEHDMNEDAADGKDKKGSPWHRMKWTDSMVKLLITAVSYTGEDPGADLGGGRRNYSMMQKKGKWKAISKVMGERGCHVSPQQCEDKFNDLNKRYKRLTDILGRGTACNVVENHTLLDHMNISEKMKEDARKILNSKHLFYEEMCSYHNNNRISLPEDPALQQSLQLALRCKEDNDFRRHASGDAELDDDQSEDSDYEENEEEHRAVDTNIRGPSMHKRMWHVVDHGDVGFVTSCSNDGSGRSGPYDVLDINKPFPDGTDLALVQRDLALKAAEIQKHRLQIETKAVQLAKQRLKWERFRKNKDRELEMMALENEQMMLENKRFELDLRHKELELEIKIKGNANHP
uniref:Myb/SANT-like DNA-binding domain-containing protein n=1 Tax=Oryza punctata TaxID=4537 RepID=A0A0E0MCT5_ORYPU